MLKTMPWIWIFQAAVRGGGGAFSVIRYASVIVLKQKFSPITRAQLFGIEIGQ